VLHLALGDSRVNTDKAKMDFILKNVRLLCSHGADVNAADRSGLCPIHYCAKTMNLTAAKYLLRHKAKVNALDLNGHTALYYVAIHAHPDVGLVEMLLKDGGRLLGNTNLPPLLQRASDSQRTVRILINNASIQNTMGDHHTPPQRIPMMLPRAMEDYRTPPLQSAVRTMDTM
jgi:ankyrin repeat protein